MTGAQSVFSIILNCLIVLLVLIAIRESSVSIISALLLAVVDGGHFLVSGRLCDSFVLDAIILLCLSNFACRAWE